MMHAYMPPTPLAIAMWKFSPSIDPHKMPEDLQSHRLTAMLHAGKQQHAPLRNDNITDRLRNDDNTAIRPAAETLNDFSQPVKNRFCVVPGQGGKKYQSVDPNTGRVWGAPNAGGRAQCSDCPGMAMSTSTRCEACWQALNEKLYTPMDQRQLAELQLLFDTAISLKTLSVRQLDDTKRRLEILIDLLKAGKISPDIQANLLSLAKVLAENRQQEAREAKKDLSKLSADHWEMHKEWLPVVQRLL
eukprot:gnl/MRDRNA2_/MRDRNA2_95763_c0_seq1.p1 gnl/MRDRNA2_/MRDRNA2_95763_c0~~gnl/MRDRNA2_/MRDRNA2_95763_c0_seq1.p1  ORF type:complete len:245 (+),score=45.07 gnl/MRDRNA2_/MRDRNA2_95763_c0_seq1:77-811(+)